MASRSHLGRKFLLKLDDLLYSKWDKFGIGDLMVKTRARMVNVAKGIGPKGEQLKTAYPEPETSKLWMNQGATSPEVRIQAGALARKAGVNIVTGSAEMFKDTPVPTFPPEAMADERFGKWPSWTDIWGRKIEGYEDGKPGYPRLDFRPLTAKINSAVTSGVGPAIFPNEPMNVSPQFHTFLLHDPMAADPYQ
jgi:hypothetical protein